MSIPSLHPTADPPTLDQLRASNFQYSLYNDVDTFTAWQNAVQNPANRASQAQIDASNKFSFYLMKVICKTYYDGDGCCLETGVYTLPFGGWCLIQSSATTMDTYRLKNGMYNDMIAAFDQNQGDYVTAIADQKLTIGPTVLDYLDVFHCENTADGFECYAY